MNSNKFNPSEFLLVLAILGVITGGLAVVSFSNQSSQDQADCVETPQAPECDSNGAGNGAGSRGVINPVRTSGEKSGPSKGNASGKSTGRGGFGSFGRGGFGGG